MPQDDARSAKRPAKSRPYMAVHDIPVRGLESRERFAVLSWLRDLFDALVRSSPARVTLVIFMLVILLFSTLLSLPISSASGERTPFHDAFFTAVSAVCVTGLTTVSTALHWSFLGQLFILIAIFIGGLGILTMASLTAMVVARKLGVRGRLMAQEALNASRLGEVGTLARTVILTSVSVEVVLMLVLTIRFLTLGEPLGQAIWHGTFYSISAFNNAGFTPHSDGLVPYQNDAWITVPLMLGVFVGSLGFPVIMILQAKGFRPSRWNLHTKLTLLVSLILVFSGTILLAIFEWNNPQTIGGLDPANKVMHSLFASVMTRSGGFSLVDMLDQTQVSSLLTDALMFVGGGSASTAGGIKVTTLAIMFLAIVAEARGDSEVKAFGRTIPSSAMRVAISVIVMGATLVLVATGAIMVIAPETPLDSILFETISAFSTSGLSMGLSASLPPEGTYVISILMITGRIGIMTFAAALALRQRRQLFRYPEERPIIG